MSQTFRFIKESNGNVTILRYRGASLDFSYSVQPEKDIRPNQNNVTQIAIPIENDGNIPGSRILNIIWTRIDWANCDPVQAPPADIWEAIDILSTSFFFGSSGGGGGGITELTGDVTAGPGSGSVAATIADNAVTFAKMQNISTAHLIGRHAAGNGDPKLIGLDGGVEFNGGKLRAKVDNSIELGTGGTGPIQLVNDAASPGNSKYYGTDSGGIKGFHDLPTGGGGNITSKFITTGSETNTTQIMAVMSGLDIALTPGSYRIDYFLNITTTAQAGVRFDFNFTGTGTGAHTNYAANTTASTAYTTNSRPFGTESPVTLIAFTANELRVLISVYIDVSLGGTLQLKWRNVYIGTSTINQFGTSALIIKAP